MRGNRRNRISNLDTGESSHSRKRGGDPRSDAADFLGLRDGFGLSEAPASLVAPFPRDKRAAAASADFVMGRIRSLGAPDAEPVRALSNAGRFGSKGRAVRIAGLAAAAVFIAALSSILTFGLLRTNATIDVRFVLMAPEASSVRLAADFNQWSPDGYDMARKPDGSWEITVPLRKGRAYAYNFILDGERWIADPAGTLLLDDGFGGSSSSISL